MQPIIMGDLNADLMDPNPDSRTVEIMALMASMGLEDMSSHGIWLEMDNSSLPNVTILWPLTAEYSNMSG